MKREFLTQFMERLIVELECEQRDGTAHVYQSTLKRLKKFANGREVSFKQLTPGMVISIRAEAVVRPVEVEFYFNVYADAEICL